MGQDRTIKICLVTITVIIVAAAVYWIGSKIQDQRNTERESREGSYELVQKTATMAYRNWINAAQDRWTRRVEAARSKADKDAADRDEEEELKQIRAAFAAKGNSEEDLHKFIELANAGYDHDTKDK